MNMIRIPVYSMDNAGKRKPSRVKPRRGNGLAYVTLIAMVVVIGVLVVFLRVTRIHVGGEIEQLRTATFQLQNDVDNLSIRKKQMMSLAMVDQRAQAMGMVRAHDPARLLRVRIEEGELPPELLPDPQLQRPGEPGEGEVLYSLFSEWRGER